MINPETKAHPRPDICFRWTASHLHLRTTATMDANEIRTVHSMLHLIFHRNKNQHQRAKWWKWLSMLKRTTWDIASSIDSAQTNAADSHRRHLAVHLIPRCYLYVDPPSWITGEIHYRKRV